MFVIKINQNGLFESVELDEGTEVCDFVRDKFPDEDYKVFNPAFNEKLLLVSRIRTTESTDEDILNIKSTFLINNSACISTTLIGDAYMFMLNGDNIEFCTEQQAADIMDRAVEINEALSKYAKSVNDLKESVVLQ